MNHLELPGPSPYGNQLRPEAVRDACRELGISDPVRIEWFPLEVPPGIAGDHRGVRDDDVGSYHVIRLSVWDNPETVSGTLWHELEHARQNEAIGYGTYNRAYTFGNEIAGYDDNPFERQARECEQLHQGAALTNGSKFDPTVPDAAWKSMRDLIAKGEV